MIIWCGSKVRNSVSGLSNSIFALRSNIKTVGNVEDEVIFIRCVIDIKIIVNVLAVVMRSTIRIIIFINIFNCCHCFLFPGQPAGEEHDEPFHYGQHQWSASKSSRLLSWLIDYYQQYHHDDVQQDDLLFKVGKLKPEVDFLATDLTSVRDGVGRVMNKWWFWTEQGGLCQRWSEEKFLVNVEKNLFF